VAAIARFATLSLQSFDHDEAVTAGRVIVPGLLHTLKHVAAGERSPPLYYILAWAWSRFFGTGEVGLRSLSAPIGTLTVPAAYLAGRELVSRRVGLLGAALVALNPYLIWYSQEARSYALMVLFVTLGLALLGRSLRTRDPGSLGLWALASALAICSHYFAAFAVAPQAALLLATTGASRRRAIAAVAAVGLVGLALVPLAAHQEGSGGRNGFTATPVASRVGETALKFVASEEPDPLAGSRAIDAVQLGSAVAGGGLFVLALGLIISRATRAERRGARIAALVAASALALPALLALGGLDFLDPRNLIGGLTALLLLAAAGFGLRGAARAGALGALAACALFACVDAAVLASPQMQRPDWRGAADAIGPARHARIIVTNSNGDTALDYYLGARTYRGPRFAGGVRTREVDALVTRRGVTAPRGFHLVSTQRLPPSFTLYRFRALKPHRVRRRDVAGQRVLSERSEVLVESGRQ